MHKLQNLIIITITQIMILSFLSPLYSKPLKIALSLDTKQAALLEKALNNHIDKNFSTVYDSIQVIPAGSYDQKRTSIVNNNVDIIDVGFGQYHEASSLQPYKVILHIGHMSSYENMFYINGLIIANKKDNVKLSDIEGRKIFAVNPSSSSGYYLQKNYLDEQKIPTTIPVFTNNHEAILGLVEQNQGSIGFSSSFVDIDPEKFSILYKSVRVPGNIVIAQPGIDSKTLKNISKILIDCYNELFRDQPDIDRILVYPFEEDYSKYLDYYKTNDNYVLYFLYTAIVILTVTLVFSWIYFSRKSFKVFLKDTGYDQVLEKMNEYKISNPDFKYEFWVKPFEKALKEFKNKSYKDSISLISSHFEGIVNVVLIKIDQSNIGEEWKFDNKNRENTYALKVSFLHSKIHQNLRSKLRKSRTNRDEKNPYTDILSDDERMLFPLASMDGIFWLFYSYRNLSIHDHIYFCKEDDAKFVIDTYIFFLMKIIDTPFVNEN